MANYLRKKGFKGKLCHYICPSVWAWGKKRIPLMASTLDRLFSILPFEAKYFAQTSLKTSYVGHPLVERLAEHVYKPFSYPQNKKLIAIFPGSRKKEIFKNFPRQVRVAKRLLDKDPDLIFGISISQNDFIPYLQKEIEKEGLSIEKHFKLVFSDSTYELMKSAMLAIAKSGTVTLELALHEVPTVVVYGVTKLDTFIAINLLKIRLPFYCIANIICEEEVFPELIGPNFTEDQLYFHIQRFLSTPHLQEQCKEKCQKLRHILQEKNASQCIAEELDLLRN